MKNMGGMVSLMGKLRAWGEDSDNVKSQMVIKGAGAYGGDHQFDDAEKNVRSRKSSKGSRKRRIARGAARMQVQDVNRLLKQFDDMQRMMKKKMRRRAGWRNDAGMKGMMPGFRSR